MQKLKHEPAYYETTKFKWRQRIGFGISDYACNLAYLLANTYLLFYYTNCAGLAAGAVGFMFVVTKFIDAFTDYMVGAMIDRTDTKMGRYRPWMLYGAPVLAVGMVLLFSVPTGWSAGAKLAWAYVTYVIFSFGYTLVNIPMAPIVSSLSPSATERTKISTTRTVFSNLGSLTSSLFVLPMVYFFSGSKMQQEQHWLPDTVTQTLYLESSLSSSWQSAYSLSWRSTRRHSPQEKAPLLKISAAL